MKILLISDLHIGPSVRCLSLVPPEERHNVTLIDEEYAKHLKNFKNSYAQKIDYIIISGDISDRGTFEEFSHFDTFLSELMNVFSLTSDKVFFTAGNHDADWNAFSGYKIGSINKDRLKQRYAPLLSSKILKSRLENASGNLVEEPYCCYWEDSNIFVLSINTAANDDPNEKHYGSITEETILKIEEQLSGLKLKLSDKIKILLMHHHPINYENISPKWKDFSMLQCNVDLLNICREHGFDFLIHGHRHQPKFQADLNDKGQQLAIICGGSFSQNFPSYIYDVLSNQLHVIEVNERDEKTKILKGSLLNFSFAHSYGWRPSRKDSSGIQSKISFGPNEHRSNLLIVATEYILKKIIEDGNCKVTDLIEDNEVLKFKNFEIITDIISQICVEHNFQVFGSDIENSVLLKK